MNLLQVWQSTVETGIVPQRIIARLDISRFSAIYATKGRWALLDSLAVAPGTLFFRTAGLDVIFVLHRNIQTLYALSASLCKCVSRKHLPVLQCIWAKSPPLLCSHCRGGHRVSCCGSASSHTDLCCPIPTGSGGNCSRGGSWHHWGEPGRCVRRIAVKYCCSKIPHFWHARGCNCERRTMSKHSIFTSRLVQNSLSAQAMANLRRAVSIPYRHSSLQTASRLRSTSSCRARWCLTTRPSPQWPATSMASWCLTRCHCGHRSVPLPCWRQLATGVRCWSR